MEMVLVLVLERTSNTGGYMGKNHVHVYDSEGKRICCNQEEKIYVEAGVPEFIGRGLPNFVENESEKSDHDHDHSVEGESGPPYFLVGFSILTLLTLITVDNLKVFVIPPPLRFLAYLFAYGLVALPVFKEAYLALKEKSIFNEFTLMGLATLGAFYIGEYPEAVAVMIFYCVGEIFQTAAISKAKSNIKSLLDLRPATANVYRGSGFEEVDPSEVIIGEVIQVKAGESVPLDGKLLSDISQLNTAAITGESAPRDFSKGEAILAGMVNIGKVIEIEVEKLYNNSSISKILELVENASAKKAKTELFIRKFARIYTPIVFFLAVGIATVPYFLFSGYQFETWLYRALVFLVISCPCALVISVPLGYFGGIGAASRHGILFKGSTYIDLLAEVKQVVMDKTGTMTSGIFKVSEVNSVSMPKDYFLAIVGSVEKQSNHPIAQAITKFSSRGGNIPSVGDIEEIPGHGLKAKINGQEVLVGNYKLLRKFNISYPDLDTVDGSIVILAVDNKYAGYISVVDSIKEDAPKTISELRKLGVETTMLSGDKNQVTQNVAMSLGIDNAFGDLLPADKVKQVEEIKSKDSGYLAFVGDGINDAPVLAISDIGIAMGAMGSDAAIETANVVIQDDKPSKIVTAIKIGRATKKTVLQNITLAFSVKVLVLVLGAGGLANMWEAVFADVGVALLAIFNAVRIQRKEFV